MYAAQEAIFYPVVFLSLLYVLHKARISRFSIFIVLVFWAGLFSYLSENFLGKGSYDAYKILVFGYASVLFGNNVLKRYTRNEVFVNIFFALFSAVFWASYIIHGGELITILSQYCYKYGMVFLIYHGLKDITFKPRKREYIKYVLVQVLYVQVALSVFKIMIFGFGVERHVGSIQYGAGGIAVVLPIVGLIFYWLLKNGKLNKWDWAILCSFIIIAIASTKRAPVFLFPVFLLLMVGYVKRSISLTSALKYSPILILLFIFGVKFVPSLTPENKVWGTFSPQYISEYVLRYNFGVTNLSEIFRDDYISRGRGGGLTILHQPDKLALHNTAEYLIGNGLYEVAVHEYGRFLGGFYRYDIQHYGLLGDAIRIIHTLGYAGFFSMICFSVFIINTIKHRRLMLVILIFYLWEFFLYGNQVMFSNASAVLVVFICFYSQLSGKINKR